MALLIEANRCLSSLDTVSKLIPDTKLFVSMYARKEALISSQIEGTQCTLDDVLDPELDSNANADVSDVINYIKPIKVNTPSESKKKKPWTPPDSHYYKYGHTLMKKLNYEESDQEILRILEDIFLKKYA